MGIYPHQKNFTGIYPLNHMPLMLRLKRRKRKLLRKGILFPFPYWSLANLALPGPIPPAVGVGMIGISDSIQILARKRGVFRGKRFLERASEHEFRHIFERSEKITGDLRIQQQLSHRRSRGLMFPLPITAFSQYLRWLPWHPAPDLDRRGSLSEAESPDRRRSGPRFR
jgi:hypothetical protein